MSLSMSLKAIAQRETLNRDPIIMAKRSESLRISPKAKAHNLIVGVMGRAAARQAHSTGIECILREFLLPTLLPGRRILSEHRIKCPADFRIQSTYQVDAYVPALRLVVEADGDYWHGLHGTQVRDYYKDKFLRADGFTVVHFLGSELNAWASGRDPGFEFWQKIDTLLTLVREEE
jgi:very-short-patch-repair endonuclease